MRAGAVAGTGDWRFAATFPAATFVAAALLGTVFFVATFEGMPAVPRETAFLAVATPFPPRAAAFFVAGFFVATFFAATFFAAAFFAATFFVATFFVATFFAAVFFVATFFAATFFSAGFLVAVFPVVDFRADAVFTDPRRGGDDAVGPLREVVALREPVRVGRVAIAASIVRRSGHRGMPGIQAG